MGQKKKEKGVRVGRRRGTGKREGLAHQGGEELGADQGQGGGRETTGTDPGIEDQEIAGLRKGQEIGCPGMINTKKGPEKDQAIEGERGEEAEIEEQLCSVHLLSLGIFLVAFFNHSFFWLVILLLSTGIKSILSYSIQLSKTSFYATREDDV